MSHFCHGLRLTYTLFFVVVGGGLTFGGIPAADTGRQEIDVAIDNINKAYPFSPRDGYAFYDGLFNGKYRAANDLRVKLVQYYCDNPSKHTPAIAKWAAANPPHTPAGQLIAVTLTHDVIYEVRHIDTVLELYLSTWNIPDDGNWFRAKSSLWRGGRDIRRFRCYLGSELIGLIDGIIGVSSNVNLSDDRRKTARSLLPVLILAKQKANPEIRFAIERAVTCLVGVLGDG
jgi:hypothetical protein